MDGFLGVGSQLVAASEVKPSFEGMLVYLGIVLAIIFVFMAQARKGFNARVFTNYPAKLAEQLYLFVENLCVGIIGAGGRKYIPMILTFWMIIFVGNVVALFFPTSVTADIGFNLGMALTAMIYVQWEGIMSYYLPLRAQGKDPFSAFAVGLFRHIGHFAGPKLGGAMVIVSGMIFLIELISETMKNVSLSLRLFGNIHGGHLVTDALNNVGAKLVNIGGTYIGFPFGALLLPIKVLTCVVQALIFTLLTCVYISLVTHHGDDHDHGSEPGQDGRHEPAHAH
ncbi:MAG: F0F1 ATP synthase subunit A [Fimbriimonadaceae bacterium]